MARQLCRAAGRPDAMLSSNALSVHGERRNQASRARRQVALHVRSQFHRRDDLQGWRLGMGSKAGMERRVEIMTLGPRAKEFHGVSSGWFTDASNSDNILIMTGDRVIGSIIRTPTGRWRVEILWSGPTGDITGDFIEYRIALAFVEGAEKTFAAFKGGFPL